MEENWFSIWKGVKNVRFINICGNTKTNQINLQEWFLFFLSFLGIVSVWSDILKEEGNCGKEKNTSKKLMTIEITKINTFNVGQNSRFLLYNCFLERSNSQLQLAWVSSIITVPVVRRDRTRPEPELFPMWIKVVWLG